MTRTLDSVVFTIDKKLLQSRPPRLTLAATLRALGKQINQDLDANTVIDILHENLLLPYTIVKSKNLVEVSLGRVTNASKIGDLIVSEECIQGNYQLCMAFLELLLATLSDRSYKDTTKAMLASVSYVINEIYPGHTIWTYKNDNDMHKILSLCTRIFHQIISNCDMDNKDLSDLEIVCLISLSQNHAHKKLLDVIVEGKTLIQKHIQTDKSDGQDQELTLQEDPVVTSVRQSLSILNKLLHHGKYIQNYCDKMPTSLPTDSNRDPSLYQHGASSSVEPTTNIERALFDTSIRPGLLHQLFGYIYQSRDYKTACLAVDLIKNIGKKFSMSLMASLGSEAERVCEFFIDYLRDEKASTELQVSILDLLYTCVKHQPGLIELFCNFKRDLKTGDEGKGADTKPAIAGSEQVIMSLLGDCIKNQDEYGYRLLHTYVLKFILTFWQKNHSALEQYEKADSFWTSVLQPLRKFFDSKSMICRDQSMAARTTIQLEDEKLESLDFRLYSYALMILAREIFSLNAGVGERKMNADMRNILDEMSKENFLVKYSAFVVKKHTICAQDPDFNRVVDAWRDFLISYAKYKPFEISKQVEASIVQDMLTCMKTESRLGAGVNKERIAAMGDTLLLTWRLWLPKEEWGERVFNSLHELFYLTDSAKEYLPFSYLLTFQAVLNVYWLRNGHYLRSSKRSFDLLVPATQLMKFSLKVLHKYLSAKRGATTASGDGQHLSETTAPLNCSASVEARLCYLSVTSLRTIVEASKQDAHLWIEYLQINLRPDTLFELLSMLTNARVCGEICEALVGLLSCLASIDKSWQACTAMSS